MIHDSATEIRHCQDRYLHRPKPSPITKPTYGTPCLSASLIMTISGDPTLSGPVSASGETIANHKADLGTSCLSASSTMTLQRRSYLQAHPASGETIANHKADLGTSCLSASLTMTPQRRSDTVRTGICIGRNGSRLLPRIETLFRTERARQEGAGKW